MTLTPRVTVLMCVYNGLPYLPLAMDSILSQSFADFEFLIVEDGSQDASWEMLEKFAARDSRVRLVRNPRNLGLTRSLNVGLEHARGQLIARQDSDDISLPQRLALQVEFMDRHPQVGLLGSQVSVIDEHGRFSGLTSLNPLGDAGIRLLMLLHTAFVAGTAVYRRGQLEKHGLRYDVEMLHAEDYDFYARLLTLTQGATLPQPLMLYRVHSASVSSTYTDIQERTAERIALQNFARAGLAQDWPPERVRLMRSWQEHAAQLSGRQRWEQLGLIKKLFRQAGSALGVPAADLALVRSKITAKLRQGYPPAAWDAWSALAYAGILLYDPAGYLGGRLARLRSRLFKRGGGRP